MDPWSEYGRFVVSHAVLQNVADAVMVAVFKLYLTPMSLEESKGKGFHFCISPRQHFLHRTQGITPHDDGRCEGGAFSDAAGFWSLAFNCKDPG